MNLVEEVKKSNKLKDQERLKKLKGKKTECEICFELINTSDIRLLDKCEHLYHPQCLVQYFTAMIEERRLPLNCPLCRTEVTAVDVKKLLSSEYVRKWEDYSFKLMVEVNPKDYSHCPTPDCPYVFIWEEGKDTNLFDCPKCKNSYCLNCKCNYHKGLTCTQYRKSKEFVVCFYLNIQLGRRQEVRSIC
jgi:ariadne-1